MLLSRVNGLFFVRQIASLLSDTSSVLNECMGAFSQPQELKVLLDNHKDISQLEDIGKFSYKILAHKFVIQHNAALSVFLNLFAVVIHGCCVSFRVLHC